jgi:hypothetical protein
LPIAALRASMAVVRHASAARLHRLNFRDRATCGHWSASFEPGVQTVRSRSPPMPNGAIYPLWRRPSARSQTRDLNARHASMKTPLQIYLDSSDYSRAAAANPTAETQHVLRHLRAWRDGGQIQIRYSFGLIAENAPTDPAYLPSGVRRLTSIQELCGDCVLLAPSLVLELERNALVAGSPHTASIARDDGNWTPLDPSEVTFPARESVLRQGLAGDKSIDRRALAIRDKPPTAPQILQGTVICPLCGKRNDITRGSVAFVHSCDESSRH